MVTPCDDHDHERRVRVSFEMIPLGSIGRDQSQETDQTIDSASPLLSGGLRHRHVGPLSNSSAKSLYSPSFFPPTPGISASGQAFAANNHNHGIHAHASNFFSETSTTDLTNCASSIDSPELVKGATAADRLMAGLVEMVLWVLFLPPIFLNVLGPHVIVLLWVVRRPPKPPGFSAKLSYTLKGMRVVTTKERTVSYTFIVLVRDFLGLLCFLALVVTVFFIMLGFGQGMLVSAAGITSHRRTLERVSDFIDVLQDPRAIACVLLSIDLYLLVATGKNLKDRVTCTKVLKLHGRRPVLLTIAHIAIFWLKLMVIGLIGTTITVITVVMLYKTFLPPQHKRIKFGRTPRDYGRSYAIEMEY